MELKLQKNTGSRDQRGEGMMSVDGVHGLSLPKASCARARVVLAEVGVSPAVRKEPAYSAWKSDTHRMPTRAALSVNFFSAPKTVDMKSQLVKAGA